MQLMPLRKFDHEQQHQQQVTALWTFPVVSELNGSEKSTKTHQDGH